MASLCADMECCLKVYADCESCMMTSMNALRSIRGVYNVEWDIPESVFRISGEVDPNVLVKAVLRVGQHAQLINVKLKHPQLRYNNHYNYRSYGPPVGNQMPPYRDAYQPSLPYYETNNDRYYPYGVPHGPAAARVDYVPSYNTSYNYHQNPLPPATHVPSLPYQEYDDPYHNYAAVDPCSIM